MAKIAGNVEDIGLFRYSLIVPAINETFVEKSRNEYFINVASKEHTLPNGTKKIFSVNSIKSWYYQYKKYGFDALKQGSRKDKGESKKIPISIIETIEEIRKTRPHITKREIYGGILLEEGIKVFDNYNFTPQDERKVGEKYE